MTNQHLSDEEITCKLHAHPQIRERIVSILSVVEADAAGLRRADDTEERLVEEVKRKGKSVQWQEAKVGLAHVQDSKELTYGATLLGDVHTAGIQLRACAKRAGFGKGRLGARVARFH